MRDLEMETGRQLLKWLGEIEEMQNYKMMILRTVGACEESATVIGSYVDILIAEFKKGKPTADDIEALRELNQTHGRILIAVVHVRVELEKIYESTSKWMKLSRQERDQRKVSMWATMDKALEIAEDARQLHEGGERLERIVREW